MSAFGKSGHHDRLRADIANGHERADVTRVGLELLPKAKSVRPNVPVIMITAYGDADTKHKALEGGAEALFTKPIDFGMLRGEIETRIERAA